MFTGIIEELGSVEKIHRQGKVTSLEVKADVVSKDIKAGDSVAVNGVCLTVTANKQQNLVFDVMPETLKISNLGELKIKDKVNLERALKIGDRLSGHFVYGHVDCAGVIRKKFYRENNLVFEIAVPSEVNSYIISKGSIAVDGISLTIMKKSLSAFSVYIIPYTLKNTTLSFKGHSDKVNIEVDLLVKSRQNS